MNILSARFSCTPRQSTGLLVFAFVRHLWWNAV